jgi:hypothetical protein
VAHIFKIEHLCYEIHDPNETCLFIICGAWRTLIIIIIIIINRSNIVLNDIRENTCLLKTSRSEPF